MQRNKRWKIIKKQQSLNSVLKSFQMKKRYVGRKEVSPCTTLEKKLNIDYESEMGRIVRIKSLLDAVRITDAHLFVNAAQLELVMLKNFKENMLSVYYF
ncbi:hypothetical protein Tco_0923032 [Tanacetum coccineum]|uniref:Uncharacterized protein n=1 Tax=Tanacetum coccineum TaxID=301880 RepID=A0ABQ5D293_9ASTR